MIIPPIVSLLGALLVAGSAEAESVSAPHVRVELLSSTAAIAPGKQLSLGVRFDLEPGWHIYWRNPGDSGEAPAIRWALPPGFRAGEIVWPAPKRIPAGPLVNFGHDGSPLLQVPLEITNDLRDAPSIDLKASVSWLVCNPEECIPGNAELSLRLPVGDPVPHPIHAAAFVDANKRVPVAPPPAWKLAATADAKTIKLRVYTGSGAPSTFPSFFPYERELIEAAEPQPMVTEDDGFTLTIPRWAYATRAPTVLAGVLTVASQSYAIEAALSTDRLAFEPFAFAFVGGILLNLMPCVFPVLALKAFALANLSRQRRKHARRHGVLYALGVLFSFWILAGILLAARAAGEQIGWGFQLQNPIFIAVLAALFFWMALMLLDLVSFGSSIMGIGDSLTKGEGDRSAFFTGVLATVVATPCTAPFMGTALGYALGQSAIVALLVFTALGAGLAMPYVVVTFVPELAKRLPRPGPWMETLKQILAFPLLATVVWLVWVMSIQGGPDAVAATLSILLLLAFTAWATKLPRSRGSQIATISAFVGVLLIGRSLAPSSPSSDALEWKEFSPALVASLLEAQQPVFVDFTAAWCVTCQVNKRLALDTAGVKSMMKEMGVVAIRADWTSPDPEITRALQQFGRDGVPLYVLYSGRNGDAPRILPQILTPDIVITELEKLTARSTR